MLTKLCFAVVGLAFLALTEGALFHGFDCPDSRQVGDTWYQDGCFKCTCHEQGYTCAGCGSMSVRHDRSRCYLLTDGEAYYPHCCPRLVCRGDSGFQPAKLNHDK
ncbi:uncharacterized protein LOC131932653 [Physella acuta]|uniref:uncharacterized protein LOC131932653 n=1 Tax=Physella acuta TaxID=109671 RepID=UPI0027DDE241|nr:uncharacterized protein LOC131932653 [Physella acuta]